MKTTIVAVVACLVSCKLGAGLPTDAWRSEALSYVEELDREFSQKCYDISEIEWNFATNINDENEKLKVNY